MKHQKKMTGKRNSWKGIIIVTGVFVTLASFLFWLDFFRGSEAITRVLVIGRGTVNPTVVTDDLATLSTTTSFYERVLAGNENLDDDLSGLTLTEQQAQWQKMVEVKRAPVGNILIIRASGSSSEAARSWSLATAKSLFEVTAFYYNIRTDVDVRLIDGPYTATTLKQPVLYSAVSIATGLLITALFFVLLRFLPQLFVFVQRKLRKKKSENQSYNASTDDFSSHIGESVPIIDPTTFVPKKLENLSFERRKDASVATGIPKNSAPENLPFAAEDMDFSRTPQENEQAPDNLPVFEGYDDASNDPLQSADLAGPAVPRIEEPTPEEYKRRLNELLSRK